MKYYMNFKNSIIYLLIACLFMSFMGCFVVFDFSTHLADFDNSSDYPYTASFDMLLKLNSLNSPLALSFNFQNLTNLSVSRYINFSKNIFGMTKQYYSRIYLKNHSGIYQYLIIPIIFFVIDGRKLFLNWLYAKDGKKQNIPRLVLQ